MLNPHPELSPELRNQSALQSLTYDQMRVAANCLWNLFAARTAMQESKSPADALSACSDDDERVCQTVYNAFENCTLALEAAHKAQKGA